MTESTIRDALDRTLRQATFTFEYLLTDNLPEGISNSTRGYCDLDGPIVAAEMTTELRLGGTPQVFESLTFTEGTTLYQPASEDGSEWAALDSHGVGSTALSALYWLYGAESAAAAGDQLAVTISFPAMFDAAPPAARDSLREGLRETRTDLMTATANGTVTLDADGLVRALALDLPAYSGPDPALDQPAMSVRLTLDPTPRRTIEFPMPSARMTPETFKNLIVYGEDRPS